ncbi:MAG: hypothetical protein EOL87_08280 [Spartobacteria bacterium]|nr:hypothetical protein [Spartobacteria bacterium]
MHTMTINIADEQTTEKVRWMLDHFRSDGVEIVSQEDLNDFKALQATRSEVSTVFSTTPSKAIVYAFVTI